MEKDRATPTSSNLREEPEWNDKQVALILSRLADLDKKQNHIELCIGDIEKKLDVLNCNNIEIASDVDHSVSENAAGSQERPTKADTSLAERQTQIILVLENMNQTIIRDNQEVLHQVRQMSEQQDELKTKIENLRSKWSMLRANIFGISFQWLGLQHF